jgi:hypothetical protein
VSNYGRPNRVLAEVTAAAAVTGAADIGTWTITGPITVARVGALVTVAQSGAAPVLSFDKRVTYGSDTGRVAGAVGVCTFPAGGVGVGKTVTVEVRSKLNTGEQIVCAITTVGGAGSVIPIIEWVPRTENSANQGSKQLGGATQPSPLAVLAERAMLDGADAAVPLQMGGSAPVLVREAQESDQLDYVPQVDGEPAYTRVTAGPAPEKTPGPQPFPHQWDDGSTPEQRERQKPWDEALRAEQEAAVQKQKELAAEQERRRQARETPAEREAREQREEAERQRQARAQQQTESAAR